MSWSIVALRSPPGCSFPVLLSRISPKLLARRAATSSVETGEHESARPAVLFDDQSAAADPFFDFSGKPISYLNVGIGGGRGIDGEQFDTRVPDTVGQSSLR